jgi:hypothetical protein
MWCRADIFRKVRSTIAINPMLRDRQRPAEPERNSEVNSLCVGSNEWGLNVIRTIWLGFTFLVVLAGAGSFRLAFGHFDTANASGVVVAEAGRTAGATAVQAPLTKAEPLAVAAVSPPPDAAVLARAAHVALEMLPRASFAMVTPDVVDRHQQEAAPPVARQTRIQRPKRKLQKPDAVASRPQPTADPRACQLEEFDAFRWVFSLPTGCHT